MAVLLRNPVVLGVLEYWSVGRTVEVQRGLTAVFPLLHYFIAPVLQIY
jgi:hypothetical protein